MIDMAEVARRAVPKKKSFLYTRNGDKGTSQVRNMAVLLTGRWGGGMQHDMLEPFPRVSVSVVVVVVVVVAT